MQTITITYSRTMTKELDKDTKKTCYYNEFNFDSVSQCYDCFYTITKSHPSIGIY